MSDSSDGKSCNCPRDCISNHYSISVTSTKLNYDDLCSRYRRTFSSPDYVGPSVFIRNFNDFLNSHRQTTLLHKKYTQSELVALIQSSNDSEQKQIRQQLKTSEQTVAMLQGEVKRISEQSDQVKIAYANWASIYDHCNQAGLAINSSSSQRYMQLNQEILSDTKNLLSKYKFLIGIYNQEINALKMR